MDFKSEIQTLKSIAVIRLDEATPHLYIVVPVAYDMERSPTVKISMKGARTRLHLGKQIA